MDCLTLVCHHDQRQQAFVSEQVKLHLIPSRPISFQTQNALSLVCDNVSNAIICIIRALTLLREKVTAHFRFMEAYADNWVTLDFVRCALKYTSGLD